MSEVAEETSELEETIAAEMGADDVDQPGDEEQPEEVEEESYVLADGKAVPITETLNLETGELTPTDESTRRAAQDSEKEAERAAKRIDQAKTTYGKKVAEIMGEDFALVHACPLCVTFAPGFRFAVEVPDEVKAAVRVEIGLPDVSNYKTTDAFFPCDTCGGLGAVATGSKVGGKETHICHTCKGKGYQSTIQSLQPPADPSFAGPHDDDGEGLPAVPPDADPWGRAPSDPLYGVMPGYER